MTLFAIISDNGSLRAGNTTRHNLDKLKDNDFEQVNCSENFLNALSNAENAFFLPKDEQDIENLYDVTNMFSINYFTKENLLRAYAE